MKIICIKLRSNSGLLLLDTQLEALSKKWNIYLPFLEYLKKQKCSKVWFELKVEDSSVVATEYDGCIFIDKVYTESVTEKQLQLIKPVVNPKRVGQDIQKEKKTIAIDLDKIVCISLKIPKDQLNIIAEYYGFNPDYLYSLKDGGCKKIWIQLYDEFVCAVDTDNIEDVYFNEDYLPMTLNQRKGILKIQPVKIPDLKKSSKIKQVVEEAAKELPDAPAKLRQKKFNVDEILDKISTQGIGSLTREEKDFLDSLGK